jgi:hypothetical protein
MSLSVSRSRRSPKDPRDQPDRNDEDRAYDEVTERPFDDAEPHVVDPADQDLHPVEEVLRCDAERGENDPDDH